jgi:hypothetical protein
MVVPTSAPSHLAYVEGVGVDLLPGHVFALVHACGGVIHLGWAHVHPGMHVRQHLGVWQQWHNGRTL